MPARTLAYPNIMYEMAIILDEDEDLRIIQRITHIVNELYRQKQRITIKAVTERKGSMYVILDTTCRRTPSFKEQREITEKLRTVCENAGYDGDPWDLTIAFMDVQSKDNDPSYLNHIRDICKRSDIGEKLEPLLYCFPYYVITNDIAIESEYRTETMSIAEKIKAGI